MMGSVLRDNSAKNKPEYILQSQPGSIYLYPYLYLYLSIYTYILKIHLSLEFHVHKDTRLLSAATMRARNGKQPECVSVNDTRHILTMKNSIVLKKEESKFVYTNMR